MRRTHVRQHRRKTKGGLTRVKPHNRYLDKKRKAKHKGRRTSKAGNVYYEYRENRADKDKRRRL